MITRPNRLRAAVAPSATDRTRPDDGALLIEPPLAAVDLVGVGAPVQTPLAAHLVLEVLHRIGDQHVLACKAGELRRLV